ncbi:DUF4450 domain-containing protein [Flavobacterium sp. RHBU_3]|uniref:DUF4450 domain-containing protein n=1 Tax=Flavobacterium sp. RHBU_3 TaxID=3391184 RepID=UPI0039848EE1
MLTTKTYPIPLRLLLCSFILLSLCLYPNRAWAQTKTSAGDFIENTSYNKHNRNEKRVLQYTPEGEDFVCINGNNRFTRALYGSHTEFRIETSDRPVFAIYSKKDKKHIAFKIKLGNNTIAIDSVHCKSVYKPGRRDYELNDTRFGNEGFAVSAQAFYDTEGGIWKFSFPKSMVGKNIKLLCFTSEIKLTKLNRNGDMGADPPDAFEMPEHPQQLKTLETAIQPTVYMVYENGELKQVDNTIGEKLFNTADAARIKLSRTLKITTPDPYMNPLGATISMAADGIWDEQVWLHGAIGWRMQLNGWRAAYTGDALGWHNRARTHFDNYAASQVTDVEPIYAHPQQDTVLDLTRALKKWGTPMYSNGYICRNPNNNTQMHHYDMNLVYIDELLWHLKWTGDLAYAKKIFPVIQRSLAWEKRNFDPDGDGLYEAYAATWASDGVMYNSGGTTVGSAYNYRANATAAEIATLIGENPAPYRNEADKILKAINEKLWLENQGWWAEYVDFMGNKMVHPYAGVWSIYTAIDSGIHNPFKAYSATSYVDQYIPHIPIKADNLDGEYNAIATSSWMPYCWSTNNVAFAETGHTALAYWQAGRANEAYNLFKGAVLDGMYLGNSPGNIGQISYYDAARGESYRDFGDPIGVYSRAVVQGLFGIAPNLLHNEITVQPGFPGDWKFAEIQHPDMGYSFKREGDKDVYVFSNNFGKALKLHLQVKALNDAIEWIKVNGKKTKWLLKDGIEAPLIEITFDFTQKCTVEIVWSGKKIWLENRNIKHDFDQFEKREQGQMSWWVPMENYHKLEPEPFPSEYDSASLNKSVKHEYVPVNIDSALNASVTDIFKNRYLTPRSPYTTMQTPVQGVGEWCHPKLTYKIDDTGLRNAIKNEVLETPFGVPFRMPKGKNNIAFTTLWDNYPDSLSVPLSGKAQHAYLLMAGTTNPMQYGVTNGLITITYTNGTKTVLELTNPDTWCPIEQDFHTDGLAFKLNAPRPYRVAFKTGIISRDMETAAGIKPTDVYARTIDGGAGIILDIPMDKHRELKSIQWKAVANEVIIGLMAVTLVK